jgi:hypothetical protein
VEAAARARPSPVGPVYTRRDPEGETLHRLVREHLRTFYAAVEHGFEGASLPDFMREDLEGYVRCGVLGRGFAHLQCEDWPYDEEEPTKFSVTTLPATMSRRQLVRRVKGRWRTERVYQDAKGELGLDHYEGRSYRGWNHHVSVVLVCFAFIVAERVRSFPPSAGKAAARPSRKRRYGANSGSPRTALRGLAHHRPASRRSRSGHVAATLPAMPSTATIVLA